MRSARLEFSRGARAAIALGASSALCGCALGPDFRPPEPPAVATYTAAPQPAETGAASGPGGNAQNVPLQTRSVTLSRTDLISYR